MHVEGNCRGRQWPVIRLDWTHGPHKCQLGVVGFIKISFLENPEMKDMQQFKRLLGHGHGRGLLNVPTFMLIDLIFLEDMMLDKSQSVSGRTAVQIWL